MKDFVRTWGPGLVFLFAVGTGAMLWGLIAVADTGQRVAILGVYVPAALTLLVEGRKRANDRIREVRPNSSFLQPLDEWWKHRTPTSRRIVGAGAAVVVLAAAVVLTDSLIRGPYVETSLVPAAVDVDAGKPARLVARTPPGGRDYLYVRVLILPAGTPGLCASSNATISYTPVLDDDTPKSSFTRIAENNVRVRLDVDGPHDRAAVEMVVNTSTGCQVNLSVKEAYYRSRGLWP